MKKRILAMALVFSFIFAFLPLQAEATEGKTITVTTAAELKAALSQNEKVAAININEDITITENCTINYAGNNINYYSDVVVTIAAGKTLTIDNGGVFGSAWYTYEGDSELNGKINNNGTIVVNSGGKINGDMGTNSGTITINQGGYVESAFTNAENATVTVKAGGTLATSQGANIVNNGTVTIQSGTKDNGSDAANLICWKGGCFLNKSGATLTMNGNAKLDYTSNSYQKKIENNGTVNGGGKVYLDYNQGSAFIATIFSDIRTIFPSCAILDGVPIYTTAELMTALEDDSYWGSYRIMDDITVTKDCEAFHKSIYVDGFHGTLTVDNADFAPKFDSDYTFEVHCPEGATKGIITAKNGGEVCLITFVSPNAKVIATDGGLVEFGSILNDTSVNHDGTA